MSKLYSEKRKLTQRRKGTKNRKEEKILEVDFMFFSKRRVSLAETDATGILYFTNLLKFATEAFEEFLESKGSSLFQMISNGEFLLPIVSAKSTYLAPLFVGDQITLKLTLAKMGNTSLELHTAIEKAGLLMGQVEIVHVVTSRATMKKVEIPSCFKKDVLIYL